MSVESSPFVVACCPARNRAWALPRWYASLSAQSRRPDAALVLSNDCSDDTKHVLRQLQRGSGLPGRLELHRGIYNTYTSSGSERDSTPKYDIANLAAVRNECVAQCLKEYRQLTHLWSVDSDVVPDADVLSLLLAADVPIVAAVVRNSDAAGVFNYMCGWQRPYGNGDDNVNVLPRRDGSESSKLERTEPFVVTVTGACVLIRRDVIDAGVRYDAHPQGEDVAWSLDAQRHGYMLAVHPLARTSHYMRRDEEPLRP